jgi:hypothetical protein
MVWYFTFRVFLFFAPPLNINAANYFSFAFSVIVCLLLVKRAIKEEIMKINEPFSLVARDPKRPIEKDIITERVFLVRTIGSAIFSIILTSPIFIIGVLKYKESSISYKYLWNYFLDPYLYYFGAVFVFSLFACFGMYPQLKNWHWTKKQF